MRFAGWISLVFLIALVSRLCGQPAGAAMPRFGPAGVTFDGTPAPPPSSSVCGFSVIARNDGPQVAWIGSKAFVASVRPGEDVVVAVEARGLSGPFEVTATGTLLQGQEAGVALSLDQTHQQRVMLRAGSVQLEVSGRAQRRGIVIHLKTSAASREAAVRWDGLRLAVGGRSAEIPLRLKKGDPHQDPPPDLPDMRRPIEQALIEWDWRMQDGIGTELAPGTYAGALRQTLRRAEALIEHLQLRGVRLQTEAARLGALSKACEALEAAKLTDQAVWEEIWRHVHVLRRRIVLSNPLARTGPLLFVKQVPGTFSHQLTQYYGRYARPGGGLFVLEAPGRSMRLRRLAAGKLPLGSYQHGEVSYDGKRILFAFCRVATTPKSGDDHADCFYHLYEMAADDSGVRQLTDGPFDDFAPKYLPDGKIVFVSTRGPGYSRCGPGIAPAYKLSILGAEGSRPRPISFHETHEWDPAVLHDGRIIYTRWDYVDRNAAHYQHLWSIRPDGSHVRIFYGNNTFNPMGTWEARPVPGSDRVMATAGSHHAMTAGSIILLDVTRGVDGLKPLTRLTPDAPFPESEREVQPGWRVRPFGGTSQMPHRWGSDEPRRMPAEASQWWGKELVPPLGRWPGHCYRSPYPLSEEVFLAAYSFDSLIIGEERAGVHPAKNMFGIYLVDRFGNKELLYRDLNISSLWPVPLRPRRQPPGVPPPPQTEIASQPAGEEEGTFFLQDVYRARPPLPSSIVENRSIKRLRILKVLPKTSPREGESAVGIPNAAPGKAVLGTVPVEPDGSACFRAPAGVPLAFQALDERGRAVQIMRSLTYLQPGETISCIGCHEHRMSAPAPQRRIAKALGRPPSRIEPGPDGSNPLSYPILVQPVLDRHCVRCHRRDKPEGDVILTAELAGRYSVSYHELVRWVSYSSWVLEPQWRRINSEPVTIPGHFGARGSRLMKLLLEGHGEVRLDAGELERLVTWMDANALFYGTFDPVDQARQRRGQRIGGTKLQ